MRILHFDNASGPEGASLIAFYLLGPQAGRAAPVAPAGPAHGSLIARPARAPLPMQFHISLRQSAVKSVGARMRLGDPAPATA
jgi:hypothetical protein